MSPAYDDPHRSSIFYILPPCILREIATNGTEDQRAAALASDQAMRELRATTVLAPRPVPPTVPQPPKGVPKPRRTIFDAAGSQLLPGRPVRREGAAASPDVAVNEAYGRLCATFD